MFQSEDCNEQNLGQNNKATWVRTSGHILNHWFSYSVSFQMLFTTLINTYINKLNYIHVSAKDPLLVPSRSLNYHP